MKLNTPVKKVPKQVILKSVLVLAGLGLVALLGSLAWKTATTTYKVCAAVQAWEDKALHATNMWRVREMLARQSWLGPLRPSPLWTPLAACGLLRDEATDSCWWRLLLQPRETGRLTACLEERVAEAEHDLEAFTASLCCCVALALVVVALGLVAARHLAHRWVAGLRGQQERPRTNCFTDAPDVAAGACEDTAEAAEQWATPAADVGEVMLEAWTTPTADVEEVIEESWATPAGGDAKSADVDDAVEGVLDGQANSVDNKATPKVEEAAEVPPVVDDSVPVEEQGVRKEGLAAKKRKRKRKKLDPAGGVPEASGEARVKDEKKTAPKDEAKEQMEAKAELKEKALPKVEAKEKASTKARVKEKAVPKAEAKEKVEVKEKTGAKVEAKEKALPKAEGKKKTVAPAAGNKPEAEVKENVPKVKKVKRRTKKLAPAQQKAAPPDQPLRSVRQSWQEEAVTVQLPVAPARRQHVIGPRGDTIRQLRRDYPGVHVAVPPLQDTTSAHVSLRGPKSQVAAAARDVACRLETIEAQIREAARRRQEATATAVLDVAPSKRRFVVGPGGEELLRLAQQHPGVRVSVPPASDTESRSVTVRGPPAEVEAVRACITARLEALERQRRLLRESRRRGPRTVVSAAGAATGKG